VEAQAAVDDLASRWLAVMATRVIESSDPVNYEWTDRGLKRVEEAEPPMPAHSGTVPAVLHE